MEKHIRKNKLKLTFTDQLGKAVTVSQDEESEVSSKKEAKKLAFYLFWNMRATLSRSPLFFFLATRAWCRPSACPSCSSHAASVQATVFMSLFPCPKAKSKRKVQEILLGAAAIKTDPQWCVKINKDTAKRSLDCPSCSLLPASRLPLLLCFSLPDKQLLLFFASAGSVFVALFSFTLREARLPRGSADHMLLGLLA